MKRILSFILVLILSLFTLSACGGSGSGTPGGAPGGDGGGDNHTTHNYTELKFDEQYHWYECECGEKQGVELHNGTATCTEQATCEICSTKFGSSKDHDYTIIKFDSQNHWYECVCGKKQGEELHSGGTATTTSKPVCEICNQEYGSALLFKREGKYVYFGRFPQTIKKNDVTVSQYANASGYYVGSDGEEYVKIISKINCYRCNLTDGTTIIQGGVYYLKLEPIRWRILDEEKGLIYCDNILYNMYWDKEYSNNIGNNYKNSDVRKWLNEDFINSAFTEEERAFIKTTLVDNSPASTGISENKFACEDTLDKVFILSAIEAKSISGYYNMADERQLYTTDYCRLTSTSGVWLEERGNWWLRSPYKYSIQVRIISSYGEVKNNYNVTQDDVGVVPALRIDL